MRGKSRGAAWAPAVGLIAIALVTYLRALACGWIWDDGANVTHCEPVLAWNGLVRIWLDPTAIQQYYPLVHTTFWIEHKLWGLNPLGFHAVNVLLHSLNAWLVWRVLTRLGLPAAAAWIAGALFAVHPVHVESIAWVTERKNTLSFAFFAASALWWMRWAGLEGADRTTVNRPHTWVISFTLFVLALLSKSATVSLPVVLLIVVWWKRGRLDRRALTLLPYFAAALLSGLLTIHLETENVGTARLADSLRPEERILVAGRALWFYASKLLLPLDLVFVYPRWKLDAQTLVSWAYPVAALAGAAALFALRRRIGRGPLAASLAWGAVLAPTLGFLDVFYFRYSFVADHFQYHASPAAFALAGVGLARAGAALGSARAVLGRVGLGALLLGLGALTVSRIGVFHDVQTLWTETLRRNPGAWIAWNNLGQEALKAGRTDEAEQMFHRAIAADSTQHEAWNNLGVCLMNRRRPDEAVPAFERAIALHPSDLTAFENLGRALLLAGRIPEAIDVLRHAVALPHHGPEPLVDLVEALARSGEGEEAETFCRAARERFPRDPRFDVLLANLLVRRGAPEQAAEVLEHALALTGRQDPVMLDRLAVTWAALGRFEEAERLLEEALALRAGPGPDAVLQRHLEAIRRGQLP